MPYPDDPDRDRHSRYVEDVPMEPGFPRGLGPAAAVDAGLDLSTYFHGKPLPGCEPGYFRGKAPDAERKVQVDPSDIPCPRFKILGAKKKPQVSRVDDRSISC